MLPDDGGVRWMQAIGVFAASEKQDLAKEFVKYILSPEGQARLATSSCYWAMPANSKAALTDGQKAVLRIPLTHSSMLMVWLMATTACLAAV